MPPVLKFIRHAFFCMFEIDMNLLRQVVFRTQEGPQMYFNSGLQNGYFTGKFPKMLIAIVFSKC